LFSAVTPNTKREGEMNGRVFTGLIASITILPVAVLAQDEGAQPGYAYVTYFECNQADEARADEIVGRNYAPHYNSALEEGDIASWGWLVHFVGGNWRRALLLTATNMDDLLDAAGALGEIIAEATPEAGRAFSEACPKHEDYIWETVPGIGGAVLGQERAEVAFSVYFQCDSSREERADEIMRDVLGPVYDRQIANGSLATWGWLKHNVGGNFRRLLSVTGSDHNSIMRARVAINAEVNRGRTKRAFTQFNEICPNHQDYMWDVQIENP
jgi:hypothetical protein